MKVQILLVSGWSAAEHARSLVNSLLQKRGISARVEETTIATAEEAAALRFPGSPTVRVNGRDIEPQVEEREGYGLGWRVYRDEAGGFVKEIPEKLLADAVEKATRS